MRKPDGRPAPDITVVVPAYNAAGTIDACVNSLRGLHGDARVEIVVVDNASTDGTVDRLRAWGNNVRVLHEATRGPAAARNCGVRDARGRLVAFTDADCTVDPGWLDALVAPLSDSGVGVVGGPILSRLGGNRIERFGERIHDQRRAIEDDTPPYVASANWASRREVLLEVGLFDEQLRRGQDVDLAWRIVRAGYRLAYAPTATVRHRNHATVAGLINEGYAHGRYGIGLSRKHETIWPSVRRTPATSGRRLMRDVRQLRSSGDRVNGLLQLAFDSAKAIGEWTAMVRGGR